MPGWQHCLDLQKKEFTKFEFVFLTPGAIFAGGISVGIYPTNSPDATR